MKNTTLVIMAAGIGSRFGKGTKQLTPVGPSGELIIDYSVHDALKAGFNKVVFIVRRELYDEFRAIIGYRVEKYAEVEYVFQDLNDLPAGFKKPTDRTKPWGTGQAILCSKDTIKTPFAVINADDYYGKEPYKLIHSYLVEDHETKNGVQQICMAGFRLGNTLSENGGVTRGVCVVDKDNRLVEINETKNIEKCDEGGIVRLGALEHILPPKTPVSMNMWGFSADFVNLLEGGFIDFLSKVQKGDITSEFLLPIYIDELLKAKKAEVQVIDTDSSWFGVTFQEDKEPVRQAIQKLIDEGVYSKDLYSDIKRI